MSGVQCLKRLCWQVHEPELGGVPDATTVAIMKQGREVGRLARQLFAGGVEVSSHDPEQAIRITRELIANPEVPAIFEAAFENGGVFVRVESFHDPCRVSAELRGIPRQTGQFLPAKSVPTKVVF